MTLKVPRTRNKVYVCRKCKSIYNQKRGSWTTKPNCNHDWILQNKEQTNDNTSKEA